MFAATSYFVNSSIENNIVDISSLRNTLLSIFALVGTALILGIFYVSKRISKPLESLIKSCNDIDPENLHPIHVQPGSEFAGIENSFNKLIGKVILNEQHLENIRGEIVSQKDQIESQNTSISNQLQISKIKSNELNQFRHALDSSSIVMIIDTNGTICHANNRFCSLSHYTKDELIGENHRIFNSGYHTDEFFKGMIETISSGNVWRGDVQNKTKDGSLYWIDVTMTPMFDSDGNPETYIVIGNDITSRKIQEEQIRMIQREIIKRKKDLELKNKTLDKELLTITKLEKQKEEFTSMMTHEFKTPLTPILSWADLLASEILGDMNEKQLKAVSKINVNALRLLHLITDVLDVHKLELSQLTYNKIKCNSKELVDELIENYSIVLNDNSVRFIHSDIESIPLHTDSSRIQQVLRIFITNALDFVPKENGTIELKVETKDDSIIFSVTDNGIGISEIDQKQLFRKFYQADTSATRKHGGSGLGLSVAKGIAQGLGGEIGVSSTLNHGSTFFVKLPINIEIIAQQ
jgi:PAS domain S-box-containing protein